jgi:hypothetical protein
VLPSSYLNSGSLLLEILLKNEDTNGLIDFNDRAALIIDGQFLVQSLKHQGVRTFGEYADMYVGVVLRKCVRFRRIDVVFDRYRTQSIKSGTQKKRSKSVQPIRRVIENRNVPLPSNLPSFLSLPENKENLAFFLATELIKKASVSVADTAIVRPLDTFLQ